MTVIEKSEETILPLSVYLAFHHPRSKSHSEEKIDQKENQTHPEFLQMLFMQEELLSFCHMTMSIVITMILHPTIRSNTQLMNLHVAPYSVGRTQQPSKALV